MIQGSPPPCRRFNDGLETDLELIDELDRHGGYLSALLVQRAIPFSGIGVDLTQLEPLLRDKITDEGDDQ